MVLFWIAIFHLSSKVVHVVVSQHCFIFTMVLGGRFEGEGSRVSFDPDLPMLTQETDHLILFCNQ